MNNYNIITAVSGLFTGYIGYQWYYFDYTRMKYFANLRLDHLEATGRCKFEVDLQKEHIQRTTAYSEMQFHSKNIEKLYNNCIEKNKCDYS